jgi:hypothetical protein
VGDHINREPSGAIASPENWNPAATVHPTSVRAPRQSDYCQWNDGTLAWGHWLTGKPLPSTSVTTPRSPPAMARSSGAPAYQCQIAAPST